jgi:hypothetical protein
MSMTTMMFSDISGGLDGLSDEFLYFFRFLISESFSQPINFGKQVCFGFFAQLLQLLVLRHRDNGGHWFAGTLDHHALVAVKHPIQNSTGTFPQLHCCDCGRIDAGGWGCGNWHNCDNYNITVTNVNKPLMERL